MNLLKGSIQKLTGFTGKLKQKALKLDVQIRFTNTLPKAVVTSVKPYTGKWYSRIFITGTIKKILAIFRFIIAKGQILHSYNTKVDAASAIEMEPSDEMKEESEIPVDVASATSVTMDCKEKTSIFVKLVSYNLALVRHIADLIIQHYVKVVSVISRLVKHQRNIPVESTVTTEATEGTLFKAKVDETTLEDSVIMGVGEGLELTVESSITTRQPTTIVRGQAVMTSTAQKEIVEHDCGLVYWIEPVLENGILKIRSVYSATKNGDILEVR